MSNPPREGEAAPPEPPLGDAADSARGPRAERRQRHQRDLRRFFGLTALGTVIPGAGLSFTRRRTLGLVILGIFVVVVVALLANFGVNGLKASLIDLAVTPSQLLILTFAIVVGALIWVASIIVTARQTEPRGVDRHQSWLLKVFTALMCLVVIAPSAQAVRLLSVHRDLIHTVFQGKRADGSVYARPDAGNQVDPWASIPRVNVLLLGSDAGPDRTGIRPDSMMIASVDTHTGNTLLVGIPRNLQNVPFPTTNPLHRLYPKGYDCGSQCLMNAVWTLAEQHRDLFPGVANPGLATTQEVLSQITGLRIDYMTIIDLKGFSSLVDAMGGVTIDVKERLPIGGVAKNGYIQPGSIKGWIEPGVQHLDGYKALWYSRSRATTDDFSRMRRQRCMVGQLVAQVNPVVMLERYPQLASVLKANLMTDIAPGELKAFVKLVEQMQHGTIRSLVITSKNTNTSNPDFAKIKAMVAAALKPPAPAKPKPAGPATAKSSSATPTPTKSGTTPTPAPTSTNDAVVDVAKAC